MANPDVSFIVPAFNEERHLPLALEGIRSAMNAGRSYEMIVADHGSTDGTASAAVAGGARVASFAGARTIGELRNRAAAEARGRVFVFLDADVVLGSEWGRAFADVFATLSDDPMVLTGSRLLVSRESTWVARTWFPDPQSDRVAGHVGSGHMILTRELFRLIEGFPPELETGEDYAICVEARRRGARIVNNPALVAYHLGPPETVAEFWRREVWHGRGDTHDLRTAARSAVAWSAVGFAGAHGILVLSLLGIVPGVGAFLALAIIVTLSVGSAARRTGSGDALVLLRGSILFYLYYWARATALVGGQGEKRVRRT